MVEVTLAELAKLLRKTENSISVHYRRGRSYPGVTRETLPSGRHRYFIDEAQMDKSDDRERYIRHLEVEVREARAQISALTAALKDLTRR